MNEAELENYRLHRRFDRMGRLVGDRSMKILMETHAMIIGLGGVGSFAAEALVRSGIGKITLVDFDEVCITNFNRQLHALGGTVGQKKADVLAERMKKINPSATVVAIPLFYNERLSEEIFSHQPDFVIDAIDSITSKCHLLATCKKKNVPVFSSAGSGGKLDPTQIKISDLSLTTHDPMARAVRDILRKQYDFPSEKDGSWGIPTAYSTEPTRAPEELHYDGGKGFRCVCPQGDNEFFNCDNRNVILGNASFVTGAFGLALASAAVRSIITHQE